MPRNQLKEIIRLRAYKLFEDRGYEHGHDVEDWLQAEAEIVGKKPVARADQSATLAKAAAAWRPASETGLPRDEGSEILVTDPIAARESEKAFLRDIKPSLAEGGVLLFIYRKAPPSGLKRYAFDVWGELPYHSVESRAVNPFEINEH